MDDIIVNSDRRFLADLNRIGSATVPQLCEEEGVTATAIRQRLLRLQAAGLVTRQSVRATRGRPHHEYQLTDEGRRKLGNNYVELATILWSQISEMEDDELKQKLMSRLRETLVKRYGESANGDGVLGRLHSLKQSLSERGFNVEVEEDGALLTLMEQNCPYHELASKDRSICDLEHDVFEEILGVPLKLVQRCVDGHNCCLFEATAAG